MFSANTSLHNLRKKSFNNNLFSIRHKTKQFLWYGVLLQYPSIWKYGIGVRDKVRHNLASFPAIYGPICYTFDLKNFEAHQTIPFGQNFVRLCIVFFGKFCIRPTRKRPGDGNSARLLQIFTVFHGELEQLRG